MENGKSKSQKRADRQRRRQERRNAKKAAETVPAEKKRKSLPGFLAKRRHEIKEWLRHYMTLICKSDDFGVPYVRNMARDRRNALIQEYVNVSEFLTALEDYLEEEKAVRAADEKSK